MKRKSFKKDGINIGLIVLILLMVSLPDFMSVNYWIKALFKISLFLLLPILILKLDDEPVDLLLKSTKKTCFRSILVGVFLNIFIVIGYFLLRQVIDFSNIPKALEETMGITSDNFYLVFMYIPLVNAFLEEFFFRNFVHHQFSKVFSSKIVMTISALLFAVYHITIMNNWGETYVIALAIAGLFIVGLFLSIVREKTKSILPTYVMHASANIAINFVALFILGII